MSAMNPPSKRACGGLNTEVDHPDISQASGNQQTCQPLRMAQVAFVEMEPATFLVGEESFDEEALLVVGAGFFG